MSQETRVGPWRPFRHYDLDAVRIWGKRTEFGMWQRHEWRRADGSLKLDPWIRSTSSWPAGAVPATAAPTDCEEAMAALLLIAAGHNDARGLAADVLRRIA